MSSNVSLRNASHCALLAGSVALPVAHAAGPDPAIQEVVVTGSRISSASIDSPSPLQIFGAQDIDATGVPNLQDILLKNPAFGTPGISRTNSNFSTASAGAATVDLRNLGTARTLVLVDGRRFVAGIPGTSAVDLNTIPAQFIERVEVLTGGASAVYGSDAVAGVVNIIYRKNFEGIAFDTQYGSSAEGDDEQRQIGLTIGTSSADGRGNIMAHIAYTDQGAVFSKDRTRSAVDQFSTALLTGDPADMFEPTAPFLSSFAPQGRFFVARGPAAGFTLDRDGNVIPFSTNGSATLPASGYNRSAVRTIAIPTERYLLAGRGNYEFADDQSAFFEGTFASTQTTTQLEPFPLDSVNIYPGSGGRVPVEFLVDGILRRNPLVPDFVFDNAADQDGDGLRDFGFTRRMSDIANRGNLADRDTFRIVAGVQGSFGANWQYDGYYAFGQTKESQVSSGQVNVLNFRNALEAIPDVNDIDNDGNVAEVICRDPQARSQGCVPVSVFGFDSITAEAAGYIQAPGLLGTLTEQKVAGVNLTGDIFDLPAGPLGMAVGAEYREEFSRSEFDALQQAGLNAGNAIPRTEGSFDVAEAFLEVNVPILANLPAFDSLNARGAVRFSDYSTVGNTLSWNAGIEWSPLSQVRFRAIRALSTRAPDINELYSPPSQTFPPGLNDPCHGVTATTAGAIAAACRTDAGVAANIAANGEFTLSQADVQGISGFNLGNPTLQEEEGKSWTFGAVITPDGVPFLKNFSFTIDYFDIEIADAIVLVPRQFTLDQCYGAGNPASCALITRRQNAVGANNAGSLEFIDSPQANSGGITTSGIDFTVNYSQEVGPGQLSARLAYTHLIDYATTPVPGAEEDPFAGEVGASEDRAYLTLGYAFGKFGFTWQSTFISAADLDDQFLAGFDLEPGALGVGSVTYHDFQATYSASNTIEVFLGANNVFDEEPPPIISGLPGNVTGSETDAGTYDAIGRRFYGGMRMKF